MNELMLPFAITLDFKSGILKPCNNYIARRLSDMRGFYLDEGATEEIIQQEDPVLYEVYQYDVPFENGQLLVVTSIIHPGKVGDEYYMTKGHFHEKDDTAEVYVGLQGQGYLLLEADEGQFKALPMQPGTVTYIPPYWAHRTVNVGDEDFIFFGVYPADAGHNYGAIAERGFSQLLVDRDGQPTFIPNPKFV
jgi:glucose-6-phosphate isomerase